MKKNKTFVIITISLAVLCLTAFRSSAAESVINIEHTHNAACGERLVPTDYAHDVGGAISMTSSPCGCSSSTHRSVCGYCGRDLGTWTYTWHCSEHGGYPSYDSPHCYHDDKAYDCGLDNHVLGKLSVSGDTSALSREVVLTADVEILSERISNVAYEWDNGETGRTITATENGTYNCKITYYEEGNPYTSNDCSITISSIDNIAPTILSLTADMTEETRDPVELAVQAQDNAGGCGLDAEPYSWDGKASWTDSNTFTVKKNGTYKVYVRDALGNIGTESIEISNIIAPPAPPAPARDTTPPVIYDLYADTLEPTDRVILTVVVEAGASISWDGGVTWDMGNTSLALANGLHTVMARDAAGNTAMRSINITNIRAYRNIAPEEEENPEITESEEVEEPEPANEPDESDMVQPVIPAATENPEPPSEEKIETVTVSQEKIQSTENIKKIITIAAASTGTVAAGGGFLFFGFVFFFGKTAVLYGTAGIMSQKIGKVKIRKKRQSYEISIPDRVLSKAPSSQLKLVFSKGFTKKHYHEIVLVHVNDKTVQAVIENEVLFDVQG